MKEILKFLKGTSDIVHPVERGMYVILGGTYAGEYMVYVEQAPEHYVFFALPCKLKREVPTSSFRMGIKNRLVDFIEQLPVKVYKTVEDEFKSINTNNNGHSITNKNNKPNKRRTSVT